MTLVARLRALRHQAGASNLPAAPSMTGASGSVCTVDNAGLVARNNFDPIAIPLRPGGDELRQRVAALRRVLHQREALRGVSGHARQPSALESLDRTLPGIELAPGVRLIEQRYACPVLPDEVGLAPLRSLPQQRQARLNAPGSEHAVAVSRLLAIDTETTGLAGGTGTRAFMIGVADVDECGLRVRQLLTTTLGGEARMLRIFCDWLRTDQVLVSYNGRSYDRPLLSTRLRLARLADPLPALQHLDLLHVTRRAYRSVWPNCRLATAERELLGVVRDDDLPGSEAPAAWLTYLRGGSSSQLRRVADHNDQDLRSLMGLVAHFSNTS